MAISDNYSPDKSVGDGSTVEFTGDWNPINASYFKLYLELISTGVRTLQTQGSDYTLEFDDEGYTATMTSAPSNLYNVIRERDVTIEQSVTFKTSRGFQGVAIENALDQITATVQDLNDDVERCVKFFSASGLSGNFTETPVDNTALVWDGVTGDIRNSTVSIDNIETYGQTINDNIDDITTVADNDANITAVAGNDANITTVATNITDVNTVATDITNVNTVATDLAGDDDIGTVVANLTNIDTVAGISADVTTTAGISADVTTVASISADITAVATNIADVGTVAGISADVTSVASIDANVTTVAGISANVTTVAGISADVTATAGISADVTTVAGISADVTTVATNDANITTVANNITGVNSFAERYRVEASDPVTSLDEGDLVFNTSTNLLKYYNGSAWQAIEPGITSSDNVTWTGDHVFQGLVDVNNINAEGSAGGTLRTSGGTNCLSWGSGGSANVTLGANMSGASTYKLTNMIDPTSAQDYATKNYVDNEISSAGTGDLLSTNNLSDVASASTSFNNIKQNATTSSAGVVEKATLSEINAGTNDKFPDCDDLLDAQYVCKAWVRFNGTGSVSINDDYNVSSVSDLGTGQYRVNFSSSMSNSSYSAVSTCDPAGSTANKVAGVRSYATSYFEIQTEASSGSASDDALISAIVFGD